MASQLASIAPATRRRAAAVVGVFAALFAVVGVLSWARDANAAVRVIGTIVLVAAAVLALIAWGLLNSIRVDRLSDELDAELAEAIAHHDATCGCGQTHDMTEMTTVCAHDGAGTDCAHNCDTCALAALRN
ncbi:MAG TPA: hypothetical protein VGL26_11845 [Jatrophihabitans sp.]|jgi:hypothetical protein